MKKKKIIFVNLIDKEQNILNSLNNNDNIDIDIICNEQFDSSLNLHKYDSLVISVTRKHRDILF